MILQKNRKINSKLYARKKSKSKVQNNGSLNDFLILKETISYLTIWSLSCS